MKQKNLSYVVKNWSLWSKFTCSKKVSWFFSKGSVFGFHWQWTMKLHTLSYSNLLSAILEDFFSIRFKSHQVVLGWAAFWPFFTGWTFKRSIMGNSRWFIGYTETILWQIEMSWRKLRSWKERLYKVINLGFKHSWINYVVDKYNNTSKEAKGTKIIVLEGVLCYQKIHCKN